MEIKSEYLQKYLYNIAIEQLSADYRAKGYAISEQEKIGNYRPDLVARKGDEVVVIEVKAGKLTPDKRRQIAEIGDFVRTHKNYKFLVVLANPPSKKQINIPNLEQLLFNYLLDHFPSELTNLPTHTRITSVEDVNIDEVTVIEQGEIIVRGNALIETKLQYGSSSDRRNDEGATLDEIFPYSFEVVLSHSSTNELRVSDMVTSQIDVSEWDQ